MLVCLVAAPLTGVTVSENWVKLWGTRLNCDDVGPATRYVHFYLTIRIISGRKFDGMKDDGVLVSVCVYFNGFMAAS